MFEAYNLICMAENDVHLFLLQKPHPLVVVFPWHPWARLLLVRIHVCIYACVHKFMCAYALANSVHMRILLCMHLYDFLMYAYCHNA
jgi:hypothetical protein